MNNIQTTIAAMMLSFKMILCLNDNWDTYIRDCIYKIRDVEQREVEKMLSCMDPEKGHSVYMCSECGKKEIFAHSCKSRICSICGKKHADEWAEKINKEMYAKVAVLYTGSFKESNEWRQGISKDSRLVL